MSDELGAPKTVDRSTFEAALDALSVAAAPCLAQPVRILAAFTLEPALDEIVKDFLRGRVRRSGA